MKSNATKNKNTTHAPVKNVTVSLSMLAIGKKIEDIKNNAGGKDMSEWNLSLFKHLR